MGDQLRRQTPKAMPSLTQVKAANENIPSPFSVAGSRAPETIRNRQPDYDVHGRYRLVDQELGDLSDRHVILFVHGYNTTAQKALTSFRGFFSSLHQAFQADNYPKLDQLSFWGFTWPGDTGGIYFNDAQAYAHHSGTALYSLLVDMQDAGAKHISLVGHSLGVHVLLRALAVLGERAFHGHPVERVRHALLLGAAVENDAFERPDGSDEYHFPESAFGMESLHIVASRNDGVLGGAFFANERDRALGFSGPESMRPLQSLSRRVREVLGEDEQFRFELHDFSKSSAMIMNPQLWVENHGDYWTKQAQMDYYVNLIKIIEKEEKKEDK